MLQNDWTPIPGYTGYFCDRKGQIASKKTKQYKLLTLVSKSKKTVRLTINSYTENYDVHYLAALTFIPNPRKWKYVRHSNGESWDNRPENLEWVEEEPNYNSLAFSEEKMKAYTKDFDQWRTLPEYPHYYFHSDGRVVGTALKVTPMKPNMNPRPCISPIDCNGNKSIVHIDKLIARAFIPNPEGYTEIKYLDGDCFNIKASNLAWDEKSPTSTRNLNKETENTDMWKSIPGYPDYLISREGELVSCKYNKYALIAPKAGELWTSYRLSVNNCKDQPTIMVQMLLGLAFIPNPEEYEFVAPRNGNLADYRLENLFWWSNPNGIPEAEWVPIKGFPDHEVSELGIRNKYTKLIMSPVCRAGGDYPAVTIRNHEGIMKCKYVHVLIAKNLIPNPNNYPVVNHKDGDRHNHKLENLEWCTHSQNLQHAHNSGLRNGSQSVIMVPTGQEIWKPISMRPDYEISNTGIVRRGMLIRKLRNLLGYHTINLTLSDGSHKYPLIHRLVASAFLTTDHLGRPLDPNVNYEVNHKNKIRSDNRVENLEFITIKEHRNKDQGKSIAAVYFDASQHREFESITIASKEMKMNVRDISRALTTQEPEDRWYFFYVDDPNLEEKIMNLVSTAE